MNKITIMGIFALVLLGIVAVAGSASAFRFGFGQGPDNMQGAGTAVQAAIENNDFNAWKTAIEATLTQDNFNKIVQQEQQRTAMMQSQQAVADAIKSGDYNAYVSAIGTLNNLVSSITPVNESDFSKLVQEYQARQSGNSTIGPIGQGIPRMERGFGMRNGFGMGRI
jgi:ABC-type glycerol-3-phosphate transport system substrate-binding protein